MSHSSPNASSGASGAPRSAAHVCRAIVPLLSSSYSSASTLTTRYYPSPAALPLIDVDSGVLQPAFHTLIEEALEAMGWAWTASSVSGNSSTTGSHSNSNNDVVTVTAQQPRVCIIVESEEQRAQLLRFYNATSQDASSLPSNDADSSATNTAASPFASPSPSPSPTAPSSPTNTATDRLTAIGKLLDIIVLTDIPCGSGDAVLAAKEWLSGASTSTSTSVGDAAAASSPTSTNQAVPFLLLSPSVVSITSHPSHLSATRQLIGLHSAVAKNDERAWCLSLKTVQEVDNGNNGAVSALEQDENENDDGDSDVFASSGAPSFVSAAPIAPPIDIYAADTARQRAVVDHHRRHGVDFTQFEEREGISRFTAQQLRSEKNQGDTVRVAVIKHTIEQLRQSDDSTAAARSAATAASPVASSTAAASPPAVNAHPPPSLSPAPTTSPVAPTAASSPPAASASAYPRVAGYPGLNMSMGNAATSPQPGPSATTAAGTAFPTASFPTPAFPTPTLGTNSNLMTGIGGMASPVSANVTTAQSPLPSASPAAKKERQPPVYVMTGIAVLTSDITDVLQAVKDKRVSEAETASAAAAGSNGDAAADSQSRRLAAAKQAAQRGIDIRDALSFAVDSRNSRPIYGLRSMARHYSIASSQQYAKTMAAFAEEAAHRKEKKDDQQLLSLAASTTKVTLSALGSPSPPLHNATTATYSTPQPQSALKVTNAALPRRAMQDY